jgi:outer membrane biosynthesis protein TonB
MVAAFVAAVVLHVTLLQWAFHSNRSSGGGQMPVHAEGSALSVRTVVTDQLPQSMAQFSPPTSHLLASPTTRVLPDQRHSSTAAGSASEVTEYAEPGALTARASPIDDIPIPAPEVAGRHGPFKAKLVLYVDEGGTVMRIDIEQANLPADLEAAARTAFATARFRPGMIEQRAVKSKLRIEVGFETEPSQQ